MSATNIKGTNGDWEINIIKRNPGKDTIKIKFTPKKNTKGCKNIRLTQTITMSAFDAAGKKIPEDAKNIFKLGQNPFKHQEDDRVKIKGNGFIVIDHVKCEGDAFYNGDDNPHDVSSKGDATTTPPTSTSMDDTPGSGFRDVKANVAKLVLTFQTCAICVDTGEILGCICWETTAVRGGNAGDTKLTSNKECPVSDNLKKALERFMKNHSKKKKGEAGQPIRFYCPDTGGTIKGPTGSTTDPFGGKIPDGLKKKYLKGSRTGKKTGKSGGSPKKGKEIIFEEIHGGGGNLFESPFEAIKAGLDKPGAAVIKFTWAGTQSKTVRSILFSPMEELFAEDIAPFIDPKDIRFINDFENPVYYPVSTGLMQHMLERLANNAEELQTTDRPAVISIITGLRTETATAYSGSLDSGSIVELVRQFSAHMDVDDSVLEALDFIAMNYGMLLREKSFLEKLLDFIRDLLNRLFG